jgi:hypothetical protein
VAEKDLIIGAFRNYTFNQVKPWIQSINESGFTGDKVLIAMNVSDETSKKIADSDFTVINVGNNPQNMMFHMERFIHIYNFLNQNSHKYRYVISTDVRDVIFQDDPSKFLDEYLSNSHLKTIASSEAIQIKNETWNRENILKCFGHLFYDQIKDCEVLNVGTLAGKSEYIRDLTAALFQMSINRADWVADQAAYNVMMNWEQYKQDTYIAKLKDAWACNLHVTNKPDQLEEFGPHLLEARPSFQDGKVINEFGQPFVIVHQYDRVPEMKKYYGEKYGIEDVITFRTDN